jgi:hypothetical protein
MNLNSLGGRGATNAREQWTAFPAPLWLVRCEFSRYQDDIVQFIDSQWTFRRNMLQIFVCCLPYAGFCLAYSSTLRMRQHTPPKHHLTFKKWHGVISQKLQLFTTTAATTSNPTWVRFICNVLTKVLSVLLAIWILWDQLDWRGIQLFTRNPLI